MKMRKELISFAHLLAQEKLTYSCFGNISLRVGSSVIIKNRGASLSAAKMSDFSIISIKNGLDLIKRTAHLSSEWKMHALSYVLNPQYNAIFHLHPFYIALLDELGLDLNSKDLEFNHLLNDKIKKIPFYEPGGESLANEVARNLITHPVLILEKHGIVVAASGLETAYNLSAAIETTAKKMIYLRLLKQL
ncbi:MAG: class II aldolase/adducin family protein [Candidatus Saelkia tenebricola]|nr:class II aldolase/adducin family protein [Candidatus Saelkia tenebricola]